MFLKEMTHGDERRLKHHQDVSAFSSGPSAKPKKLTKRPRPSSYQEESSPEVSPPRGGTLDETECLKMHSSYIHTTWEIVNYSKEDPLNTVQGITDLLQFRHNWNQEVISKFYSTLFYDKKERIFMWMTNSRRFHVKLAQFA
jgi:hypothetical protein